MNISETKTELKTITARSKELKSILKPLYIEFEKAGGFTNSGFYKDPTYKKLRDSIFENIACRRKSRALHITYAFIRNKSFPEKWFYNLDDKERIALMYSNPDEYSRYQERRGNQYQAIDDAKKLLQITGSVETQQFDVWIEETSRSYRERKIISHSPREKEKIAC